MRIALDARTIYSDQRRGTGKNLIDLYNELAIIRPNWRVLGYHRQREKQLAITVRGIDQTSRIEMRGDRLDAWGRWRLPMAAWRDGADVLHCPANTCPNWMPTATIVTIHDLIPLDMPMGQPPLMVRRFEQSVRCACRSAAHILTPSQYTCDRLVSEFHADPARITVNPWAADSHMRQVDSEEYAPVLQRYGIRQPFILHFGAGALRKNTKRVIEAWSTIDRRERTPWSLLVVGLDESARGALWNLAGKLHCQNDLHLHTFADESDLPPLLSAADVLAYPSLCEGFGLPILDAWATSTPVLTSCTTSLPEIAGDAAIAVDPTDACAIAGELTVLMTDRQKRRQLVARGRRRLKHYTWRATATRFAQAFESAVTGGALRTAA